MNSNQSLKDNPCTDLADSFAEAMQKNEIFLKQNENIALGEIVWLVNDVFHIRGEALKFSKNKELCVSRSMFFYIFHILQPFAYSICLDLLASNLPACYFELRLLLETLVKSYISDKRFPDISFYQERMELLDKDNRESNRSIATMMTEFGKDLRIGNEFKDLWKEISEKWIHTKGIMNNIVENIAESSNLPPWGLFIPMEYTKDDLNELKQLNENVSKFGNLLKKSIENYLDSIENK